jgi:endonuclease YncB( thermonuclease family)
MKCSGLLVVLAFVAFPAVAFADPCEGQLPHRAGQTFSGTVRYVGDGDSLCVGQSNDPNTWIEVRLADFNAPEFHSPTGPQAKAALERIAMGHVAQCVAGGGRHGNVTSYDRVIATCSVNGRRIGDLMRAAGVREGGN